jgi:(p)ppGpp synthase/HD superfamily hydrolase
MSYLTQTAYEIANQAHSFQFRKHSSLPYIVHPCRVASKLAIFNDDCLIAAGFLHDVLEDCDKKHYDHYFSRICDLKLHTIIKELTYSGSSKDDKDTYMNSFWSKSATTYIVKLADRIDNILDFANCGNVEYSKEYAKKAQVLVDIWDRSIDMKCKVDTQFGVYTKEKVESLVIELKEAMI